MELLDVVMKLNGPIDPVGDTRVDSVRLANLKALCDLTGALIDNIASVANTHGDRMASIKAAKDVATEFLRSVSQHELIEPVKPS